MELTVNKRFSRIAGNIKRSAIRELLKLTQQPDIISFAGGLPSPESFPVEHLKEIMVKVLEEHGAEALQYGTTEGDLRLRELLLERMHREGVEAGLDNLVISTASQQGLDLIGKIFLDPGDVVLCGSPSYLGGLSAFSAYGAHMIGIPFDRQGMRMDELASVLRELREAGRKVKFIYLIPDFQNPAGITLPERRRRRILELAEEYDTLILEDSPYREIRFEGKPEPMMKALDSGERVITLGTFSKIFVPGFRLGWVVAHRAIIEKFVMAKQNADLCAPVFLQKVAAAYLESGYFEKNLKKTVDQYREKRDLMIAGFRKYMPEEVTWTEPEGGLFLFMTLPSYMNAERLLKKAIIHKVAFVAGNVFFPDNGGRNTIRINFSYASKEENRTGVERLAEVIREEMENRIR